MKIFLKRVSQLLPDDTQKRAKVIYRDINMHISAVKKRRKIFHGVRIVFPDAELGDYEHFEMLSPGHDEVLVKSQYTVVSPGTERANLLGLPGARRPFPLLPGYSGSGIIFKTGKCVNGFKNGDWVAGRLPHSSHALVKPEFLFKLSSSDFAEESAFIELGIISLQGIRKAGIKPGESVLVIGQGIIGQLCNRLARLAGATPITALARTRCKAELSTSPCGADNFLTIDEVQSQCSNNSYDVVMEATGNPYALTTACRLTRYGGRVILIGSSRGLSSIDINNDVYARNLTIIGAHITGMPRVDSSIKYRTYRDEGILFIRLIEQGKIQISDLVTCRASPFQADNIYRTLAKEIRSADVGIIFAWNSNSSDDILVNSVPKQKGDTLMNPTIHAKTEKYGLINTTFSSTRDNASHTNGKLGIGIVGGGDIGLRNAISVSKSNYARVISVFDVDSAISKELARKFSVKPSPSYESLIADKHVDAVLLSVPHYLHSPLGVQAADAGKHILIEKPLGVNLEAAGELIDACRRNNVRLSVNFSFRYKPHIIQAKQLIDDGVIGNVAGIQVTHLQFKGVSYWTAGYMARSIDNWRGIKAKAGGGILLMGVSHTLDYLRYMTGLEITDIYSSYGTFASPIEVEDNIALTCRYSNGATGTITASTCWRGKSIREDRIWGSDGAITLYPAALEFWSAKRWRDKAAGRHHSLRKFKNTDFTAEWVERFAIAVLKDKPTEITGKDGWINNAVLEAAYLSQDVGKPVQVTTWEDKHDETNK